VSAYVVEGRPPIFYFRGVHGRRPLIALAGLVALLLVAFAASAGAKSGGDDRPVARAAWLGPFTGSASGVVDRYRHTDNGLAGSARFFSDSKDFYRARFTYAFIVHSDGRVEGRGYGNYVAATWRLEGRNPSRPDNPDFACEIPVSGRPFDVKVTGTAERGTLRLRFALVGAGETNADYDCAGFVGYQTQSTYVADSLDLVQKARPIVIDQRRPRIRPLDRAIDTGNQRDYSVHLHNWDISVRGPAEWRHWGRDAGPGAAVSRNDSRTAVCTIVGSARRDRIRGTEGDDVICGLGGSDIIDGRGGNDLIYGGPGNDRITGGGGRDALYGNAGDDTLFGRDGRRDTLDGGAGNDIAAADRRSDRIARLEGFR
jgi:hypothetical protein